MRISIKRLPFFIDAQATELIVEFLVNSHNLNTAAEKNNANRVIDVETTDPSNASEPKTRKSLALKILALKCAAHLKWNFQLLENRQERKYFKYVLF